MKKKYDKVLIIDDNEEILIALKIFLRNYANEIFTINSPKILKSTLIEHNFDIIILDMNYKIGSRSGNEGLYWLNEILEVRPESVVICITAYGEVKLAVEALQKGAADFIEKPWDEEQFLTAFLRAGKLSESKKKITELKNKNTQLTKNLVSSSNFIKGNSNLMQGIWQTVSKIAPTDANVIITGENGTGKELIAKQIHQLSERKDESFISVDLGSLAPSLFESEMFGHIKGAFTNANNDKQGWFEIANSGTIFLDEIGNLTLEQQAKLLSTIQNKTISPVGSTKSINLDVRIISATNADLKEMVNQNNFREDLLYRLNTILIELPPLRKRKDDIPLLLDFYLDIYKQKYKKPDLQISSKALNRLQNYSWPGNIRELKHSIERATILCETSTLQITDFYIDTETKNIEDSINNFNLEKNEKDLIVRAINNANGNYTKAAEILGISRRTLYNKIEKYEL